jgi:integrase
MTAVALLEVLEFSSQSPCNDLGHTAARVSAPRTAQGPTLHGPNGERKYLNRAERSRFLAAAEHMEPTKALFALVLAWTGARISEVLALTPSSFQPESGLVTIVTLKRRKLSVREVPIPPELMRRLDRAFSLRERQLGQGTSRRLWGFCRVTGWRAIKKVMEQAGIVGRRACPRGLRHAFGVGTLQSGVPMNITQRWLGHARMTTTAIYAAACGPEEMAFARRFWRSSSASREVHAAPGI